MGCGSDSAAGSSDLGHIASEILVLLGSIAAQVAALLASGPVLGFLTALVLLLAVVALAKFILTSTRRSSRRAAVPDGRAP